MGAYFPLVKVETYCTVISCKHFNITSLDHKMQATSLNLYFAFLSKMQLLVRIQCNLFGFQMLWHHYANGIEIAILALGTFGFDFRILREKTNYVS